jgi:hypothetical protein
LDIPPSPNQFLLWRKRGKKFFSPAFDRLKEHSGSTDVVV